MSFKEPRRYFCQCCNVYMGHTLGSNGRMNGRMNGRLHEDGMRYYCWDGWNSTPYCSHCYNKQLEEQQFHDEQEELERKYNESNKQVKPKDDPKQQKDKANQKLVKLGLKSEEEVTTEYERV